MAKIKHIALATHDLEATAQFYRDVFGLQIVGRDDVGHTAAVFLSDGDINLTLLDFRTDEAALCSEGARFVGWHHVGFLVADEAENQRVLGMLREWGAPFLQGGPVGGPGTYFEVKVKDPNGATFDVSVDGWRGISRPERPGAADVKGGTMNARKMPLNPPTMPPLFRPYYSETVKVAPGPLLFISGQVAFDKQGDVVGKGDIRAQATQALENLRTALAAHGATLEDLVKITVYTTDMKYFEDIAEIRMKYFPKNGPTSAIFEVSRLALPDLLIEIESIAVVN